MGFKQVMNCETYCITNLHVMALIMFVVFLSAAICVILPQ